jgi:glycosyltransferase involved in cell wall biosynthesis
LKVAVDMLHEHSVSKGGGIGRYADDLIAALVRHGRGDQYLPVAPGPRPFHPVGWANHLKRFITGERPDIFLLPSPFEWQRPMPRRGALGACKLAAVLYDLIPLRFPHTYLGNAKLQRWYYNTIALLRDCDLILANSEATRQDAVHLAGMDGSRIAVIYGIVDDRFAPGPVDRGLLAHLGITGEYALYVGALKDPRKNLSHLLEAFTAARASLAIRPQLVIVSKESPRHLPARAGLSPGDVIVTGPVPDDGLIHLYRGASFLAHPSLWEGLGLTVLEAMACGTPVLTSATSAMLEVASGSAELVDPGSVPTIAEAMTTLWRDPQRCEELRAKGLERVQAFRWAPVAGRASAALRSCVGLSAE